MKNYIITTFTTEDQVSVAQKLNGEIVNDKSMNGYMTIVQHGDEECKLHDLLKEITVDGYRVEESQAEVN